MGSELIFVGCMLTVVCFDFRDDCVLYRGLGGLEGLDGLVGLLSVSFDFREVHVPASFRGLDV